MKKLFLMSIRFNKSSAKDFHLEYDELKDQFYDPLTNIEWKKMALYDCGWGRENGFCKMPPPSFEELWNIVNKKNKDEQTYLGSLAYIQLNYMLELKEKLSSIKRKNPKKIDKLFKELQIDSISGLKIVLNESNLTEAQKNEWYEFYNTYYLQK